MFATAVRVLPHGGVVSALAPPNQSQRRGFLSLWSACFGSATMSAPCVRHAHGDEFSSVNNLGAHRLPQVLRAPFRHPDCLPAGSEVTSSVAMRTKSRIIIHALKVEADSA
jgi:hypothetical protein